MGKNIFITVLGIMLLASIPAFGKNPLGPGYAISFARGVVIDGNFDDWSGAEWVKYSASSIGATGGYNWNNPETDCTFAMMYDDEALYCAAKVNDDIISFKESTTPFEWWTRDGVMWFIDFTNNDEQEILLWPDAFQDFEGANSQKWLPGEMIVVIGATEDQTSIRTRRWSVGTRNGDRSDSSDRTMADGTVVRGEVNENWESKVIITGTNYIVEAKVPWSSLERSQYYSDPVGVDPSNPDNTGGLTLDELDRLGWKPLLPNPLAGSKIGFTHLWIDCDLPAGGFDAQVMWVGDGDIDARWTEATFAIPTPVFDWDLFE
ncbi:MAG: sugar-binding protein [Candidatus Omnitrophota bacterium]